jgi:uncharacterized membrane protein required for colicin V production
MEILQNHLTDFIAGALLIIFFAQGYQRGILLTALRPVALLLGIGIAAIYFQVTQKLPMSLLIALAAPFLINFAAAYFIKMGKMTQKSAETAVSRLNAVLGGVFNFLWGTVIVSLCLALFLAVPDVTAPITQAQKTIKASYSHNIISGIFQKGKTYRYTKKIVDVLGNPLFTSPFASYEVELIRDDKTIQRVLENEEVKEKIHSKDYFQLMSHPYFKQIMADEYLMKSIVDLDLPQPPEGK